MDRPVTTDVDSSRVLVAHQIFGRDHQLDVYLSDWAVSLMPPPGPDDRYEGLSQSPSPSPSVALPAYVPVPDTLAELQVALSVGEPDGTRIAAWRDTYLETLNAPEPFVELCVDELHSRQLCYSCGRPADRLVNGEFPWVCAPCEAATSGDT